MKNKRKLLGLTATASLLSLSAVLASCNKVKQCTVTFKNGTEVVEEQPVQAGFNAKVPTAPTSGDLEFNGWYADEAKTTPFDFGSVINEDTTVYANWVNKYTVTFNSNGGTTVAAKTVREGGNVAVPTAPTKAGRVFNGWYANEALTTPFNFGSIITSNTTIYAKWELATYNVTLYKSSTEVYKTVGVKDGELLEVGENPAINYQTFVGWYTDPSLSDDSVFDVTTDLITEDTNLYAKFAVKSEEVEYKFDYETMIAKYGAGNKSTQIEKFGGFYVNTGAYGEYKQNYYTGDANQPDINNQQQPVWFSSISAGQLTFDWRYRSGSSCQVKVYELDEIDNSVAPVLANMDEDAVVYNTTSGSGEHAVINIKADKSYVIFSIGSVQIHELKYTNTVGASKPADISVSGALNAFLCGDEFVSTGLSITMSYENGRTESVPARDVTVDTSAVDLTKEGTYTVTVNYNAEDEYGTYPLSDTYEVNVYAVDTIKAFTYGLNSSRETVHNKLVYAKGDTLNLNGVYVHAYGTIGEGATATNIDDQLAASEWELAQAVDMTTLGRKTVTLKYKQNPEVTTSFDIEVVDKLLKKEYPYAEVVVDANAETAAKVTRSAGETYTFKSITEALQYFTLCELPSETQKVIVLKNGTYNEKVYIDIPNVTIIGENYYNEMPSQSQVGAGTTFPVITFDKMNGLKAPNGTQYSTDGAATFTISKKATNCTVCGVKIMNYYNTNALYQESLKITHDTQATACLVRGDMATFAWVTLSGYHDTLYADNGRQMYYNCDIEGRTDFIFGDDSTAYFQNCTIRTIGAGLTEKNGGYVVATKGKAGMNYGYIFNECNFVADAATQAGCVSIARGWADNMKIMVMNSNLGAHFSKGTYGQTYYEKAVTADTFASLLETGLYTLANENYTKVAGTAEFDANATYYVQLNDRYTKMNAAPHAELLSEYNNEGNGAIAYTAELAALYAEKTFTLLNPADAATRTAMAKYEDMNTVFKADNGAVKYAENWNPEATLNPTILAVVTVNGMDGVNATLANYKLNLKNVYVGNTLVDSQISSIKSAVKKALNDGYSLVGLYTDAEFTTELTPSTVLTANTQVYARIIEGTLEVVDLAHYEGANVLATAEGVNKDEVWTASLEKDGSEKVSSVAGADVKKTSDTTDDTYATYERSKTLTTLRSPKITDDDVKEVSVVAFGGTLSTGNSMKVEIKAYAANGDVVATKAAYTPGGKVSGYLTTTADGDHTKEEKITLKSTGAAISYVTVQLLNEKAAGGSADGKSFTFTHIQTTYEKIVKVNWKNVSEKYAYDYSKIDLSSATTKTAIAKKNLSKYTETNWANKVTKVYYKNGDNYEEVTTYAAYEEKCALFASLGNSDATALYDCDKAPVTTEMLQNTALEVDGAVTFRSLYTSSLGVVEVAKGAGIKVTFKGTGTLKLTMLSSSSSNTSTFGVKDKEGNFIAANTGFGSDITAVTDTNTYNIKGTSGGDKATITYNITEAGTYEVFIPSSSANVARIATLEASDNYKVVAGQTNTSELNKVLSFTGAQTAAEAVTYDNTVFDISGATIGEGYNAGSDYASNKLTGSIKVNVKKGAVVYVSAYYSQAEGQVNYTITANGTTTDVLHANSFVVATVDQEITITGSANNYFQEIIVAYPFAEAKSINFDCKAADASYAEGKTFQYSAYLENDFIINSSAPNNTAKVTARANENWGQFTTGANFVVVLKKGQTVSVTTYNGTATMTAAVLDGTPTTVENAGAQQTTSYTATADYTVVVITSVGNDYVKNISVTE